MNITTKKLLLLALMAFLALGIFDLTPSRAQTNMGQGSLHCCLRTFSSAGTPTHYDIPIGVSTSARIDGATDAGSPLQATLSVFVKSNPLGNTTLVAKREGSSSNYIFTYTPPALAKNGFDACGSTVVAYKNVDLNSNDDYRDDGLKNDTGKSAAGFRFVNAAGQPIPCGEVHGYQFHDLNANGKDDGEPRLKGFTISLTNLGSIPVNRQAVTDANGEFRFMDLPLQSYRVCETAPAPPAPWQPSTPLCIQPVQLSATNTNVTGVKFGNFLVQTPGNRAPVLASIGDQIVPLGSSLNLTLSASDLDRDSIAFGASPLPLPANASLHAVTGVFTFKPDATQVGSFEITFQASDGRGRVDSETVTITIQGPAPGGIAALTGRILNTNDFVQGRETPVVGATVSLLDTARSTISNGEGRFTLAGIPAGSQVLDINTATASPAPDGSPYAGIREELALIEGVTNVVDRSFFLPRIASESLTPVDPNATTVVTNPTLKVSMTVPPNTAKNPDGTNFTGELSISEVPKALAPAALPHELKPGLLITIQPVGVTFSSPVPITFPNIDNLAAGSETDIWSLDPETGTVVVVGKGRVGANGFRVETIEGGIRAADWHMVLPPAPKPGGKNDAHNQEIQNPDASSCPGCAGVTTVSTQTGGLTRDPTLPSYRSLGVSRDVELIYNSLRADPRPVIPFDSTIPVQAAVPPVVSYSVEVAGIQQGREVFVDTGGLNESIDETIRNAVQFDARHFPTGRYSYRLVVTSDYLFSRVSSTVSDMVMVVNEQNSPFGAGWGLAGLQRLRIQPEQDALVTEGGSGALLFKRNGDGFQSPPGDFSTLVKKGDGTFTRTLKDGTKINFSSQGFHTSTVDRNGNTTVYDHHAQERLIKITDPRGLVTRFSYTGSLLSSATDPAGRVTTFTHDAAGNLSKITYPDGSTESFKYDDRHLLTEGTNQRGFITRYEYDFAGRHKRTIEADGSTREMSASQLVGLVDITRGLGSEINPAPVRRPAEAHGSFTDGNGNSTVLKTDSLGNITRQTDALARTTAMVRDLNGNPTRITRPNGAVTRMTYDERGNPLTSTEEGIPSPPGLGPSIEGYIEGYNVRPFATIAGPRGLTFDPEGNLYTIGRDSGTVFKITPDGQVSVFAELGPILEGYVSLVRDPTSGDLFASRFATGEVLRIPSTGGSFTVFASGLQGPGDLQFGGPGGDLFVSEFFRGTVARITPDGSVSTFATGLSAPDGLSFDAAGNLYIENRGTNEIFRVGPTGGVASVFVSGLPRQPLGLTFDPNGNLLVADFDGGTILKVTPDGVISALGSGFVSPEHLHFDPAGVDLFISDFAGTIYKATPAQAGEAFPAITRFTYGPLFSQVPSITDPKGNTTTINYDAKGNPIKITDAKGTRTRLHYEDSDCPGQVTSVTSAVGLTEENTTTFEYDTATCNLVRTIDPLGNLTTLAYDAAGNVVRSTDAEGRVTRFKYDAMNRLTRVVDATNAASDPPCSTAGVACYQYDSKGNLTKVMDARGNTTTLAYDALDRLIKSVDPLGNAETFSYDGNGNLRFSTDRKGQKIEFQYDKVNQLKKKLLPEGLETAFAYDTVGNLREVTDPDSKLTMGYDLVGRLISGSTAWSPSQPGFFLKYAYDKSGNRKTLAHPTGQTGYVYDELNRLRSLTNPSGQSITFDYDPLSRRTKTTLPNGTTASFTYDPASQLLSLVNRLGATTLSSFNYTYDKVGNRKTLSQQRSAIPVAPSLTYKYDDLNRLIEATRPLPANRLDTSRYDAVGNRLRRERQATDAIFDKANRLREDQSFTYDYDLNGNLTKKTEKGTGATSIYIYDAENQLVRIDFPGGGFAEYRYDGLGRRIEKNLRGEITRYVYDNEDILLELDGANKLVAHYHHGPGIDQPLIMERDLNRNGTFEASERFFYHTDGLGSITELTNLTGAVTQAYIYDAFGQIIQQVGTLPNPYAYTGREFDPESGLYYYRARNYFRSTSQADYASGARITSGGFSGGGLKVKLGGIDEADIFGNSVGWRRSFHLAAATEATLSIRHKLTQASDHESDEFSKPLLSLDRKLVAARWKDNVAQIFGNGGSTESTGWEHFELNLGTLAAGAHTLIIGAYQNKKTIANEVTEALMGEVVLSASAEASNAKRTFGGFRPAEASLEVDNAIREAAARFNLPRWFYYAIVERESSFDPYAIGPYGEPGLTQLNGSNYEGMPYPNYLNKPNDWDVGYYYDMNFPRFGRWIKMGQVSRLSDPFDPYQNLARFSSGYAVAAFYLFRGVYRLNDAETLRAVAYHWNKGLFRDYDPNNRDYLDTYDRYVERYRKVVEAQDGKWDGKPGLSYNFDDNRERVLRPNEVGKPDLSIPPSEPLPTGLYSGSLRILTRPADKYEPTPTSSPVLNPVAVVTPTPETTPILTPTPGPTPTPEPRPTPTATPGPTPTLTPAPTPTPAPVPTPTPTPMPGPTPTPTPQPTPTPTPSPASTPEPTPTPSPNAGVSYDWLLTTIRV